MGIKKCGLYIRVSTERQAKVEEGSLKNQEQNLSQFVNIKNDTTGEQWVIVDKYIDKGISAKNTNRPAYSEMIEDINDGRINAVLCVSLSRISRSTRDLLDLVENLNAKGVDFISLKEQFDTTTSQGKCFLTIMAALNQFEREQCSERTSASVFARAQRGLWNGGHILGYNLVEDKKGYLAPSEREAWLVNFLFDTYLETGSVLRTAEIANEHGYVTKDYTSRRGRKHPPKKFGYSSVLKVLTNKAYVGIKEVNKKRKSEKQDALPKEKRYMTCEAVWPPIVEKPRFDRTQWLLKENFSHKNNGAKSTKHHYLLNGGMLFCHKCGTGMGGRNGHGHSGRIYYYYYCKNKDCGHKVSEPELEQAIQYLARKVVMAPLIIHKITEKINQELGKRLPRLAERRRSLTQNLGEVNAEATKIISNFSGIDKGKTFVDQRLSELDEKKKDMIEALSCLENEMSAAKTRFLEKNDVCRIFNSFSEIFESHLKPYQKRVLLNWLLHNVRIGDDKIKIGIVSKKFRSDITQLLRGDVVPETSPGSQS